MPKLNSVSTSTLEEQKAWSETAAKRLDDIYKQLCEYDNLLNAQDEDDSMELMKLLEAVEELYSSTTTIRLHDALMKRKYGDLEQQMQLLQQSVDLLKLENKS